MGELIGKIIFLLVTLPFMIASEAYHIVKKFITKHHIDYLYVLLTILVIIFLILMLLRYGYN